MPYQPEISGPSSFLLLVSDLNSQQLMVTRNAALSSDSLETQLGILWSHGGMGIGLDLNNKKRFLSAVPENELGCEFALKRQKWDEGT